MYIYAYKVSVFRSFSVSNKMVQRFSNAKKKSLKKLNKLVLV